MSVESQSRSFFNTLTVPNYQVDKDYLAKINGNTENDIAAEPVTWGGIGDWSREANLVRLVSLAETVRTVVYAFLKPILHATMLVWVPAIHCTKRAVLYDRIKDERRKENKPANPEEIIKTIENMILENKDLLDEITLLERVGIAAGSFFTLIPVLLLTTPLTILGSLVDIIYAIPPNLFGLLCPKAASSFRQEKTPPCERDAQSTEHLFAALRIRSRKELIKEAHSNKLKDLPDVSHLPENNPLKQVVERLRLSAECKNPEEIFSSSFWADTNCLADVDHTPNRIKEKLLQLVDQNEDVDNANCPNDEAKNVILSLAKLYRVNESQESDQKVSNSSTKSKTSIDDVN